MNIEHACTKSELEKYATVGIVEHWKDKNLIICLISRFLPHIYLGCSQFDTFLIESKLTVNVRHSSTGSIVASKAVSV